MDKISSLQFQIKVEIAKVYLKTQVRKRKKRHILILLTFSLKKVNARSTVTIWLGQLLNWSMVNGLTSQRLNCHMGDYSGMRGSGLVVSVCGFVH